ncbi:uncharacterized protein PFL1_01514 [Pseudozyma flocculosa PF-1]|uniref:Uncharacterized protein n=1 Tax=Pseudozyma flocculosa TaxID=84751 RepID=A0A5C3FDM7_9BASI|nr:uncharacterized protein PFL1_01514 [Pseudozyma flocculosa PF-1]EPQ31330.1 hypothetical protein PFL1_01514 [Pseudozyma flocculosa PF-1]SPO41795.1 uncharacterized protein PSFLO_07277 [Pseudozyma flocculosa]
MKFSGSFTAFVVASVATANLAAAAPIGQVNTQATNQTSNSPSIQTSNVDQNNKQNAYSSNRFDVDQSKKFDIDVDNSKKFDVDVDHREKNIDVDVDQRKNDIDIDSTKIVNKPDVGVQAGLQNAYVAKRGGPGGAAFGSQGASANGQGGASHQGQSNHPVVSGAGNSITTGGAQGAENNGIGGTITQSLEQLIQKRLFAAGKQGASADGFGGQSAQGQSNVPVVSGAGNSITTGGQQGSQNNGQGGQITQKLLQQLTSRGLGTMLGFAGGAPAAGGGAPAGPGGGFAQGGQFGSADAFGGLSKQGQSNRPVLSGAGNSLTSGGAQGAENSAKGGNVGQELLQKLGAQKRQLGGFFGGGAPSGGAPGAYGAQGASANGQGGYSSQFQSNRPVVSGYGNSVTTGGAQGATNNGQGGSISQSLEQLLGRDVQGQGQGVGQGTQQFADSNARGGNAYVVGANGPVALDGSARGGYVGQTSGSKQAAGQSATQDASYSAQNNFAARPYFRRAVQGQGQGIGQGTGQYGSAAASGGNAFVAGANGPVYVKTAAQGGAVQQGSASEQQGSQSGTQGLSSTQQNNAAYAPYWRREVQGTSQGSSQSTTQAASSDAKAGDVNVVDVDADRKWFWTHEPEFKYAPQVIDTSAKAGSVSQKSESNQANSQKSGQANKETQSNNVGQARRGVEVTHEFTHDRDHLVTLREFSHDRVQVSRTAKVDRRGIFQGQNGAANAVGGNSADFQNNGGFVTGDGKSFTSGGPQLSNNSGTGGQLSQLLNPQQ